MKSSYERLENNLKELQSAYNKQCLVLYWKRNFIDSINDALSITQNSLNVTGENALDAINDLKAYSKRLEKELAYYKRMIADANEKKYPEIKVTP